MDIPVQKAPHRECNSFSFGGTTVNVSTQAQQSAALPAGAAGEWLQKQLITKRLSGTRGLLMNQSLKSAFRGRKVPGAGFHRYAPSRTLILRE